jgi:hypothetical protein
MKLKGHNSRTVVKESEGLLRCTVQRNSSEVKEMAAWRR